MLDRITVHGARQHNLKNIDVEIPRNAFTVITGLSGSGKAFAYSFSFGVEITTEGIPLCPYLIPR